MKPPDEFPLPDGMPETVKARIRELFPRVYEAVVEVADQPVQGALTAVELSALAYATGLASDVLRAKLVATASEILSGAVNEEKRKRMN